MKQIPSALTAETQAAQHAPTAKVGAGVQLLLALVNAACWLAVIPLYQILLPLQIAGMDSHGKVGDIALLTFIAVITALIAQPLTGAFSDRTTSRWGRRKPWMLAGMLCTVVALFALAFAKNLLTLTLALASFGFTINMLLSALLANIPDRIPSSQRATASAIIGLAQPVGTLLGILALAQIGNLVAAYAVIAALLFLAVSAFVFLVPEQPVARETLPPFAWKPFLLGFVRPLAHRDFALAWIARFWTIAAQTLLATYILFYVQDAHLLPAFELIQGVALFQGLQTSCLVVTSLLTGRLSDRLQRRKVFVLLAGAVMTVAFLGLAFWVSWPMVLAAGALFGAGFGIFVAGDLAISTLVLPDSRSEGKDLGIITAGSILPELLFPLVSWLAFTVLGGYGALFLLCAGACILGALFIVPIRAVR